MHCKNDFAIVLFYYNMILPRSTHESNSGILGLNSNRVAGVNSSTMHEHSLERKFITPFVCLKFDYV